MEFKQLSISGFRQDTIGDYNVSASGFRLALLGTFSDIPALELFTSRVPTGTDNNFPFKITQVPVPQERPCSKLIEHIDLSRIYGNCTTQQSQELALDPVYVADHAKTAPRARIQQLEWGPVSKIQGGNEQPSMAVLTSYGSCRILTRSRGRLWSHIVCDFNKLYLLHSFPFDLRALQEASDLKAFKGAVDLHWITAFAWHPNRKAVYTANAVGWVVVFQYNASYLSDMNEYLKHETKMGRISYIRAFDDFLLIGNVEGVVKLFKLSTHNDDTVSPTLSEVECLWSKADRMSCRKAEVSYSKDSKSYYVVFAKAAHILAYQLSVDGYLLSSCTLYVGGIKITGIETLCLNEFVVTTIIGVVKHLTLEINASNELKINEHIINSNLDIKNYQILGVAASPNKALWSFVLYRNKDYNHQSKLNSATTFLSVCKLTSVDPLAKLDNINLRIMNPFRDYATAIRLDIANRMRLADYNDYYDLQHVSFPSQLNYVVLKKLQIKLMVVQFQCCFREHIPFYNGSQSSAVRYAAATSDSYNSINSYMSVELNFLLASVQATYIICRLQQLECNISSSIQKTPTQFQIIAGSCLKQRFQIIIRQLQATICDENHIKDTTERFIKLATQSFEKIPTDCYDCKQECLECNTLLEETTMLCPLAHNVRRCCVSYVQVPLSNRRHCAECNKIALDDDSKLRELLGPDEELKCTFCCFSFVNQTISFESMM